MKKIFRLLSAAACILFVAAVMTGCSKTFDENELKQLQENISVYCTQAHENIISDDKYCDAVLLETVIEYHDTYDNTNTADWGHIYSKYRLSDGTVVYLDTPLYDMSRYGEMADAFSPFGPFEEREEYYNAQRDLADCGKSSYYGTDQLEEAGDGVYVIEKESSSTYYFIAQ